MLSDADVCSHIAVGRWILAHGEVPTHDVFSHSMQGAPWVAHEWLVEVISASVYDRFGWPAIVALFAGCFAIAIGALAICLRRYLPPAAIAIAAIAAWGMCMFHLSARPHVMIMPLLVVWTAALVRAREENRPPAWWFALLIVLWANLHGSFVFAIGLAVLFAAEAVLESDDWRRALRIARQWLPLLVLSCLATLATPNGVRGVLYPFEQQQMSYSLSWINEWQQPNFQQGHVVEGWLILFMLGALTLGVRVPLSRALMVLLLLHMTLLHQRHAEILGLCAPLLLAPALARWFEQPPRTPAAAPIMEFLVRWTPAARASRSAAALAIVFAIGTALWRLPNVILPPDVDRSAAIAAVRSHGIPGNVFNSYGSGGYLMFVGVQPFIDGRNDMYGDPLLRRYNDVDRIAQLLADYDMRWSLFRPDDRQVGALDRMPGWRRLYADQYSVVHVRE